ncbi:MAG TPA: RagB/SusD family nutrient uptake outer membrane protein [Puia sp.]|nr:RagB/SusD family nutrient uptake outer membrane protein [Puia sp.]
MKKLICLFVIFYIVSSCNKLNVTPQGILQNQDVLGSAGGVTAYMAGLYRYLPIEDFKYSTAAGFNQYEQFNTTSDLTGEGMNKNVSGESNGGNSYWSDAYLAIRNINTLLQTLPKYATSINNPAQVNSWLGEGRFMRAYTYFALVKRYGGVPIIKTAQNYPGTPTDSLMVQRGSEQEVYDFIADDLDSAISLMLPKSEARGRANKYVAAAFKSRAMLFAGSVAKYNIVNNVDNRAGGNGRRVQGIAPTEAIRYFKSAYAAAKLVETGGYKLYRTVPDKVANYSNLFFDLTAANTEVIFAKEYSGYPDVGHSYDVFGVPLQMQGPDGYGSYICPTLDFVELFDGLPKNPDGTLQVLDAGGKYIFFNDRTSIFQNAEPRLLATVTLPGSTLKGEVVDVRRGIYTAADVSGGITPALLLPTTTGYTASANFVPCTSKLGIPTVSSGAGPLNSGGLSGVFGSHDGGTLSGFFIRKSIDQNRPKNLVTQGYCTQPYMELRYAEVLLNRAEAAYELNAGGQADVDYLQDAYTQINDIRDRAGAVPLTSKADLTSIDTIRKEIRKELGFENKVFWDLKRWRTADTEINNRVWWILNPIYVAANGKYIYDRRKDERNSRFTFSTTWYYEQIPAAEISRGGLYQNL